MTRHEDLLSVVVLRGWGSYHAHPIPRHGDTLSVLVTRGAGDEDLSYLGTTLSVLVTTGARDEDPISPTPYLGVCTLCCQVRGDGMWYLV